MRAAAFNPRNDKQVATGSQDGRLGLWDLATGQSTFDPVNAVPGAAPLLAVAYSHNATRIAASSRGHEARIWTLAGSVLALERSLAHPATTGKGDNWVFDVSFHPEDHARLITAAADGRARLWTGGMPAEPCAEIPVHAHAKSTPSEDNRVLRASFGPVGAITATITSVRAWEPAGTQAPCWRQPWEIRHGLPINDVGWGPDNRILTASDDGTARVSDGRNGNRILTLRNGVEVKAAAFDRQGRYVITGDSQGSVRRWRVTPDDLARYLAEASTACLPPADRERFLSEDQGTAQDSYESCERKFGRLAR